MPTRTGQQAIYTQRINAVIDHVRARLDQPHSLAALARVAGFSPFHFHRLFKALTGETINDLVARLRLERAVALLRAAPSRSITQAAREAGFASTAVFSRAFKKQYGFNARQWDRQRPLKDSKNDQHPEGGFRYTLENLSEQAARDGFVVRLRSLPAQRLAYIRVFDAYRHFGRVQEAYERLTQWYVGQGGRLEAATLFGMSQDDPDITPLRLCRFDWSITAPAGARAEGEIGLLTLPACRIAAIHCLGDLEREDRAFQYLFRDWLPRSRYQPANLPAMEIYRRPPAQLGWQTFDLECAVPIVAL